ncbi:hypothetical protein HNV11_20370 [Spirosoma taeanense]|uniref:Uncharacterized protein n=1 Tax=Spirosoma taeanense TaxID=2735870 RepID=A0A6M5YC06_9BACT|nr:hypothetical protein [Spirosoma taeanense]QJW91565.1 hypothetical protein HNV11_20370 [Spirosoma taeanense]
MKDKHLIFALTLAVLLFGVQEWASNSQYDDLAVLLTVPIFILAFLGTVLIPKTTRTVVRNRALPRQPRPERTSYFRRPRSVFQLSRLAFLFYVRRYWHFMR